MFPKRYEKTSLKCFIFKKKRIKSSILLKKGRKSDRFIYLRAKVIIEIKTRLAK